MLESLFMVFSGFVQLKYSWLLLFTIFGAWRITAYNIEDRLDRPHTKLFWLLAQLTIQLPLILTTLFFTWALYCIKMKVRLFN